MITAAAEPMCQSLRELQPWSAVHKSGDVTSSKVRVKLLQGSRLLKMSMRQHMPNMAHKPMGARSKRLDSARLTAPPCTGVLDRGHLLARHATSLQAWVLEGGWIAGDAPQATHAGIT